VFSMQSVVFGCVKQMLQSLVLTRIVCSVCIYIQCTHELENYLDEKFLWDKEWVRIMGNLGSDRKIHMYGCANTLSMGQTNLLHIDKPVSKLSQL